VTLRGVFDCHKMVAHPADVAEGADRLGRICQEGRQEVDLAALATTIAPLRDPTLVS
jgi:hypothetical protein